MRPWTMACILVAATLPAACEVGDAPPGGAAAPCDVGWGELAITEILADPAGPDAGAEWFELVNVSGRRLALSGLTLRVGSAARPRTHEVLAELDPGLEPGAYLAIGNGTLGDPTAGYAWPAMTLANGGGTIEVRCGDLVVDRVAYGPGALDTPPEGRSIQLSATVMDDPSVVPAEANDLPDAWCETTRTAPPHDVAGNRGTPGAPNAACPRPGWCRDADGMRPARAPGPGDAILTEVFADTPGVDDPMAEWVEIRALAGFDLSGLVLEHATAGGTRTFAIATVDCLPVSAGGWHALGATADPSRNGGVDGMRAAFPEGLNLYNGPATLTLRDAAGTPIARAAHPGARPGIAVGADPADGETWCFQRTTGRFDGTGTPGGPNDPCGDTP